MKKLILSSLVISVLFTSCKGDKNENNEVVENEKPFTVTVNAIIEKDDEFQIYFNEDGSEAYQPEQYVNVVVKGNPEAQDLVFVMPKDVSPMNLRFDLGSNKEQKDVKFNSFDIDYKDKKFSTKGAAIFKYFYPNTQVTCDTINASAKINVKEGENYDPIIGATPTLKTEIQKLYSKK